MDREEAIKIIKDCKEKSFKRTFYTLNEYYEALDMAIKALEQQPCDDAISRQAALECCRNEWEEEVEIRLKSLPSVSVAEKTGHWIEERKYMECPNCHDIWHYEENQTERFKCCPTCGKRFK